MTRIPLKGGAEAEEEIARAGDLGREDGLGHGRGGGRTHGAIRRGWGSGGKNIHPFAAYLHWERMARRRRIGIIEGSWPISR